MLLSLSDEDPRGTLFVNKKISPRTPLPKNYKYTGGMVFLFDKVNSIGGSIVCFLTLRSVIPNTINPGSTGVSPVF